MTQTFAQWFNFLKSRKELLRNCQWLDNKWRQVDLENYRLEQVVKELRAELEILTAREGKEIL